VSRMSRFARFRRQSRKRPLDYRDVILDNCGYSPILNYLISAGTPGSYIGKVHVIPRAVSKPSPRENCGCCVSSLFTCFLLHSMRTITKIIYYIPLLITSIPLLITSSKWSKVWLYKNQRNSFSFSSL